MALAGETLEMVGTIVEMERSYLTAEIFHEILASSTVTDELSREERVGSGSSLP